MQQQFKKGDVISVQGVVRYDQSDEAIAIQVGHTDVYLRAEMVTLVRPFFKPGDTAYLPNAPFGELRGFTEVEVIATHEEFVWLKDPDGKTNVALATDLQRTRPVADEEEQS